TVVFPLAKPAVASLGIFQFLWVWNDLLVALVFADTENQPMTKALQSQMRQFGTNVDVLAPGSFLSVIIPLILFFAFQRYFVQGLLAGSVK
ncbi:MAG: carbohydrate ABC transporter permease, partial [Actinomycetes bacterium]